MKSIEINITPEEKTIVKKLCTGEKSENIGLELGYTAATFATKMKEIRRKYNVKNSVQLVAFFLREGIIS